MEREEQVFTLYATFKVFDFSTGSREPQDALDHLLAELESFPGAVYVGDPTRRVEGEEPHWEFERCKVELLGVSDYAAAEAKAADAVEQSAFSVTFFEDAA